MLYSPSQRSMVSSCRKFPGFFSTAVGPQNSQNSQDRPPRFVTEVNASLSCRSWKDYLYEALKLDVRSLASSWMARDLNIPQHTSTQWNWRRIEAYLEPHTVERQLHKTHRLIDLRSGCPLEPPSKSQSQDIARYLAQKIPASFLEMPLGHNQVLPQLLTSTSRSPEVSPSCNAFGSRARCSFATTLCGPWGKTSRSRSDTTLPFWKEAGWPWEGGWRRDIMGYEVRLQDFSGSLRPLLSMSISEHV